MLRIYQLMPLRNARGPDAYYRIQAILFTHRRPILVGTGASWPLYSKRMGLRSEMYPISNYCRIYDLQIIQS